MADVGLLVKLSSFHYLDLSKQTDSFLTVDAANLCEFHKWPTVQLSISPLPST